MVARGNLWTIERDTWQTDHLSRNHLPIHLWKSSKRKQALGISSSKTKTLDNGRENHLHEELKKLGMKTYFADPYASWQRGTNEYHNGLLRRYLPKGTSFTNLSQQELNDILDEINSRPRKVLRYKTPKEILSGAIQPRM